jgi:hypothetical protein
MFQRNQLRSAVVAVIVVAAGILVTGCSSSSSDASSSAPIPSESTAAAPTDPAGDAAGTDAMRTLCDQMVADKLSPEDATALAEQNGYVARVGTIDGVPQAVTMDFREDRFTFEVTDGAVSACTYG